MKNPKNKSINNWAFLKKKNNLEVDGFEQSINSEVVIACIDKICERLDKKTILVIDSSPLQRSNVMLYKLTEGEDKGLAVFFLPT